MQFYKDRISNEYLNFLKFNLQVPINLYLILNMGYILQISCYWFNYYQRPDSHDSA